MTLFKIIDYWFVNAYQYVLLETLLDAYIQLYLYSILFKSKYICDSKQIGAGVALDTK